MSIPSTFIDRLLSSINIVDVIGRRLTLERKGGAYWAKCPFHGSGEERTASFKVYEETGTYHCFGCKESGNAIHFLRKHDGLDFLEAVETLATQVGMEIPKQEAPIDTSNATKINNRASQVFYEQLKSDQGKKTIKYLKERGVSGETAKFFQLGYSSNKKPTLYENLKNEFKEINQDYLVKTTTANITIDLETDLCFQSETLKESALHLEEGCYQTKKIRLNILIHLKQKHIRKNMNYTVYMK